MLVPVHSPSWMEALAFICPYQLLQIAALNKFLFALWNTFTQVRMAKPCKDSVIEDVQVVAHEAEVGAEVTNSRWFALYTTCRHEKRIAQHLSQREIEHYLPLYQCRPKMARRVAGDAGPATLPQLYLCAHSSAHSVSVS